MATSYNRLQLTTHSKPHQPSGVIQSTSGDYFLHPKAKNLESSSQVNLNIITEDINVTPSAVPPVTILSTGNGQAVFNIDNTRLNFSDSLTLTGKIRNTSVTTRTSQAITITPYNNTDGAASTPDGGNYHIASPYGMSTILAFGDNAATIQAAIRAISTGYAAVTVAGSAVTAIVVTMVGIDSLPSPELWGVTAGINDGGVGVAFASTISVAFTFGDEVKLVPDPLIIENIKLLMNHNTVDELSGNHLWYNILGLTTNEERKRIAATCGFDSTTNLSNNVIVNGSPHEFFIPLIGCPLNTRKFPIKNLPGAKNDRIRLEVYFKSGVRLLESGAGAAAGINYYPSTGVIGDVEIYDLSLIMGGQVWDDSENKIQRAELLSKDHDYRYHRHHTNQIGSTAYTANITVNPKIHLTGYLDHVWIVPLLTNGVGSNIYVPRPLTSFEIEASSGKSLTGDYSKPRLYHLNIESLKKFNTDTFSLPNSQFYYWSPSANPMHSKNTGTQMGTTWTTTNETMKFSTANTETLTISTYASLLQFLKIKPSGEITAELI